MSFDVFLGENVTVAIYETGVGGENDSTNVIEKPVVTGITGLGIDHEKTLKVPTQLRPLTSNCSQEKVRKRERPLKRLHGIKLEYSNSDVLHSLFLSTPPV